MDTAIPFPVHKPHLSRDDILSYPCRSLKYRLLCYCHSVVTIYDTSVLHLILNSPVDLQHPGRQSGGSDLDAPV